MNRDMRMGSTLPFAALGVALLGLPLSANALIYSAEAIEGWVVDAETSKPLEGVIVVAHWQLKGGLEGGDIIDELKILETVTDENGRYSFPSWGPKFAFSGLFGHQGSESPGILMFKWGYKFKRLFNYRYRGASRSDWDKQTVKLERFTGTLEQYAQHMWGLNADLWMVGYISDPCGWKRFPKMLRAMDELGDKIKSKSLHLGWRTVTKDLRINDAKLRSAGCGTVADFLGK